QFGYEVSDVKSEDMMHQIIDNLIKNVISLFSRHYNEATLLNEFRRNIRYYYPDFLLYNKNIHFFFGDMKFLICYAAAGWKIGFYAIDGTPEAASMPSRLVHLAGVFDLRNPYHRIKVVSSIINIIRVLLTISPILPTGVISLGKPLKLQPNSIITFDCTSVTKEVPIEKLPYADDVNARVKFLSSMYACAKGRLSLVQAAEDSPTVCRVEGKKMYQLIMKTRGKRAIPEDEQQLKKMTKNILVGLECLHEGGFVHRDIRMSNILYVTSDNPANSSYVLIDFEHGGKSGDKITEWLKNWDDGTLDRKKYTKMSDIYQFGKLLEEFFIIIKSDDGRGFVAKLKKKDMDASEALKHPWLINL
ncbi:22414_t:CDS:2, partial [Gigaspora rosea]